MLDIKLIRENKDLIKEASRKKLNDFDVEKLLLIDEERLKVLVAVEEVRARQNKVSAEIPTITDAGAREQKIAEMKVVKEELQKQEEILKEVMKKWQVLMLQVPNIPDISVPEGKSDADNKEISLWGDRPKFNFTPKSHIELMQKLHLADLERGAKVAGFRGYFLKNEGLLLSMALWQFAIKELMDSGFAAMLTPSLVRPEAFMGTGYLPNGEEDLYKTQDGDYLSGTAEVGTMGFFMDEVLEQTTLPKKVVAFSPCFRREAGAHGKDTRGLIRVHEFYKVEQVVLCEANHEESVRWHEQLRENAENLLRLLGIPYRVVINCTGDLGQGQVKKYDIEAWMPTENKYRETHSISYFHDFQTRRMNIRYRDVEGKMRFAHSLNGTALPTPRVLIALIENYQNADGSITVPEVLRPYLGGREIIK